MSDPVHIARSCVAHTVKKHGRGSAQAVHAKRSLQAAKLERHVTEVLATAPTPTASQLERIAALLTAGSRFDCAATDPGQLAGAAAAPSST